MIAETSERRICMVVHARYPYDPRVAREALAARDAGFEIEVIALRERGESAYEEVDGIVVRRVNVSHRLWSKPAGLLSVLVEYFSFAVLAAVAVARRASGSKHFDVLHVHNPPDFLVFVGVIPKLLGRKVVLDVHDRTPLIWGERFGGGFVGRAATSMLGLLERAACRFADHVITVHKPYRDELSKSVKGGVQNTTIVMNSPRDQLLEKVRSRSKASPKNSDFTIAYHGTITPWYGLSMLVEALAEAGTELMPWRALLIGDGDAISDVEALASRLGVADRIELTKRYLEIEEALVRISTAHCGVIPNLPTALNQLTLSTKLLEYVSLGVPAVVARLDALSQHFNADEVTFFEAGNPEALCNALLWVQANPKEAGEKAQRARVRFQEYSWPANERRLLSVFNRLSDT